MLLLSLHQNNHFARLAISFFRLVEPNSRDPFQILRYDIVPDEVEFDMRKPSEVQEECGSFHRYSVNDSVLAAVARAFEPVLAVFYAWVDDTSQVDAGCVQGSVMAE